MDLAMFHSIWTVVVLVIFLGIVAWAWSGNRKKAFDEAAQLAVEDDGPPSSSSAKENQDG